MTKLPIDDVLPDLRRTLQQHHDVVLEAPPGAGKTSCVPLAMLNEAWLANKNIIMLEPRRLAARAAAERMAKLLNESVGQTVGYRVRLENKTGPRTRIVVVTEGILSRMLLEDPALENVALLIFDEFHERSVDADTALALSLQAKELFRDGEPLKLLIMSATLDGDEVSRLLGNAPVIRSEGKSYPVEVKYGKAWNAARNLMVDAVATINQAIEDESGSLLVFLPGQKEITQVYEALLKNYQDDKGIMLVPLYGNLSLDQQHAAIEAPPLGIRKVVLATDIAETSLTIDGIRVVVDVGLSRNAVFDAKTGMTRLVTRRVSQASSIQRRGRAGRLSAGVCYRLWSESQQQQLVPFNQPAIMQADLVPLALQLLTWGVSEPDELTWLDPPPATGFKKAVALLGKLGAVSKNNYHQWQLNEHGELMAKLPVHPRLAHMLIVAEQYGMQKLACDIAALLSERDPLRLPDSDIQLRLDALNRAKSTNVSLFKRIKQQSQYYQQLLSSILDIGKPDNDTAGDESSPRYIGFLLACAYPDRIAQQRSAQTPNYRLSNGRAARLNEQDSLINSAWIVAANVGGQLADATDRIYLAADLDVRLFANELSMLVTKKEKIYWDKQQRFIAEQQDVIGELVFASKPVKNIQPEQKIKLLLEFIRKHGLSILSWSKESRQWQARVLVLYSLQETKQIEPQWPDISDQALLASLEDWLRPYLEPIVAQITCLADFKLLNVETMLKGMLPWELQKQLDALLPEKFQVPSGSTIRIDYLETPPVLAVRMQEMFGCSQTPRLADGRIALKIHLLSPARRPLQVTQDLMSFWENGYPEVKKEMKGRYPKHYWPDDPMLAEATARVRPKTK